MENLKNWWKQNKKHKKKDKHFHCNYNWNNSKKKPTRIKRETKDCKEKTCTKRERAKRADQTIFAQLIYFKHA